MTDRPTPGTLSDRLHRDIAEHLRATANAPRIPEWRRRALEDHARRGFVAVKEVR
jgi:hypothetical protein